MRSGARGELLAAEGAVIQPRWGDVAGPFDPTGGYYVASDDEVAIVTDAIAALNKFGNRPGSPSKVRVDIDPCAVDFKINIPDIFRILDAFRGLPFPFSPTGGLGCHTTDPCSYWQ